MSFEKFASAVRQKFTAMSAGHLFDTSSEQTTRHLEQFYQTSFPEGTNPIYLKNPEHECSTCRHFIRAVGSVVSIDPDTGALDTIWNIPGLPYPYDIVAKAMHEEVIAKPITGAFFRDQHFYGEDSNIRAFADGKTEKFHHFSCAIANRHFSFKPGAEQNKVSTRKNSLKRALTEYKEEAYKEVVRLIDLKGDERLYRGAEYRNMVVAAQGLQEAYNKVPEADREAFLWANHDNHGSFIFDSAIGTLVENIGLAIDEADGDVSLADILGPIRIFESFVDPTRKQRPTAPITPAQVEAALKTIEDKGLRPALERRHARMSDITVNNVLWASAKAQTEMKDSLATMLMAEAVSKVPEGDKATDIAVADFLSTIAPTATAIEAFVANTQMGNFMSLTAPVHAEVEPLFKWSNNFAWSYTGNITDAIRERVKKAGGNVDDARMRVSLSWSNYDDLDLHCVDPEGEHIYFGNPHGRTSNRILDVDMNAGGSVTREPVENLSWLNLRDGNYQIYVHNFARRESTNSGFTLQIATEGGFQAEYTCDSNPGTQQKFDCLIIKVSNGVPVGVSVNKSHLSPNKKSVEKWSTQTNRPVQVSAIIQSPNFWDGQEVGNKHWFFILEGCKSDEATRGFYNEFLRSDLHENRKVFEILADKTQCAASSEQLSGVGFSSTKPEKLLVQVTTGTKQQLFNIVF